MGSIIEAPESARITDFVPQKHRSISKSEGKNPRFLMERHKSSFFCKRLTIQR